jgi:hypothetical protein
MRPQIFAKQRAIADGRERSKAEHFHPLAILADRVCRATIDRYKTRDVFRICHLAGVNLDYQRWALVTIGECQRRPPTIRVNLAALDSVVCAQIGMTRHWFEQIIIAHELGHLLRTADDYAANEMLTSGRKATVTELETWICQEHFADSFAAALLNLSRDEQETICRAVHFCRLGGRQETSTCGVVITEGNSRRYA